MIVFSFKRNTIAALFRPTNLFRRDMNPAAFIEKNCSFSIARERKF